MPAKPLKRRIIRKDKEEFHILCDVCSKTAIVFKMGLFLDKRGFVYTGITHETTLDESQMPRVFEFLTNDDLAGLHKFLNKETNMYEGLDAYCPECDKAYCSDHMRTEVVMDEDDPGFYDCTYGTCPAGHRRMIDD
jgi:hypothetical protein